MAMVYIKVSAVSFAKSFVIISELSDDVYYDGVYNKNS